RARAAGGGDPSAGRPRGRGPNASRRGRRASSWLELADQSVERDLGLGVLDLAGPAEAGRLGEGDGLDQRVSFEHRAVLRGDAPPGRVHLDLEVVVALA